MKMRLFSLVIVLMILFSLKGTAQTFSVNAGTGIDVIIGDNYYSGELSRIGRYSQNGTVTSFNGLKFNNEIRFQAGAVYSFGKTGMSLIGDLAYLRMRGKAGMNIYDSFFMKEFHNDVTTKLDIWSLQTGSKYELEIKDIKPFLTASFLFNYFDDTYVELVQDKVTTEYPDYENGFRLGYGVGAGVAYEVSSEIRTEFSAKFNDLNYLNRRDGEEKLLTASYLINVQYLMF